MVHHMATDKHEKHPVIQVWSTNEVPRPQRFDYWANALSLALTPMRVDSTNERDFSAQLTATSLGPISVTRCKGTSHNSHRARRELSYSQEHSYHLLVSVQNDWGLVHRGHHLLSPGDVVFTDSQVAHDVVIESRFDIVNLKLPVDWVNAWLPDPSLLVGRPISRGEGWGQTLSSVLSCLSPEFVASAPVPHSVLADQIGALLAMNAGGVNPPKAADRALRDAVHDCIVQRCSEPMLTASDIAACLSVSESDLHAALSAFAETFATSLLAARVDLATQLLTSPVWAQLTETEIGRQAGFVDMAHFERACLRCNGRTPAQMRTSQSRQ